MTDKDIENIKQKVEKKLVKIQKEIDYLKQVTKPIAPENSLGRITRMDAINNKSVNEATLRQAQATQNKLEYMLKRIEAKDATLGTCSSCKATIPLPRILLMPESDKCVNCAN